MSILRQFGRLALLAPILITAVPAAAFDCKVDFVSSWSPQPPKGPLVKLIEASAGASPERKKALESEAMLLFSHSRKLAPHDCGAPLLAAANGYHDLLEHFIAAKVDMYDGEPITEGVTPLHAAVLRGHLDVVKLLIEKKAADIDEESPYRGFFPRLGGMTALIWAVYSGRLDIAEYLLSKGANTAIRGHGRTALDWAQVGYNKEMLTLLKKYGVTK
jgi:hypothetical protein